MTQQEPWVGEETFWGGETCTFALEPGDPSCGKPALHHLLTETVNPDGTLAALASCTEHYAIASRLAIDSHDHGGVCGMPDTLWIHGTPDAPGRCIWPQAEQANAALAASTLELVRS